ncbi:MAG: hypothetical protein U0744_13620 [Gemmataceae bacterium]
MKRLLQSCRARWKGASADVLWLRALSDAKPNAAVLKTFFRYRLAGFSSFQRGPFDGVYLQKTVQVHPVPPEATIVMPVS